MMKKGLSLFERIMVGAIVVIAALVSLAFLIPRKALDLRNTPPAKESEFELPMREKEKKGRGQEAATRLGSEAIARPGAMSTSPEPPAPEQQRERMPLRSIPDPVEQQSVAMRRVTTLDIPSFYGETRAELDASANFPGTETTISPYLEWGEVQLHFNGRGCLAQITFWPRDPMPIDQAKIISDESFGVTLLDAYGFRNSGLTAYRKMPGLIRTVNCEGASTGGGFLVSSISYFYNLEWNEDSDAGFERTKREFEAWRRENG